MAKKRRSTKRRGQSAAFMRSINPNLKKRSKSKSRSIKYKGATMAKKRSRKGNSKSSSILGFNTAAALAAVLYGAVRAKTSTLLSPYTAKIPLGNVSDEAGMLIVTSLGKKFLFKKKGTFRDVMTAGQTIELARIGDAIVSGELNLSLGKSSSSASSSSSLW